MKAYVMAAGVGTRLEPLTLAVPKPMVPVCNIPIMEYNISLLKKNGLLDITANLHYFPEHIENYFKDGSSHGVRMSYSFEEELMGTAGGVKKMAGLSGLSAGDNAVVLSADVLTDINLGALIDFHKDSGSKATMALVEVDDTSEFGVVVTDNAGRITAFQEKPKKEEALSRLVNTGVYILEKEVIDLIPPETFYDFGKQLFPLLVKNNVPFFGFSAGSYWKDIGNISNYLGANFDAARGTIKTSFDSGKALRPGVVVSAGSHVDDGVVFSGAAVIGPGCTIEKGVSVKDSVLWSGVRVGKDASIDSCVIGSHCIIEAGCSIGKGSVIAGGNHIKKGSVLPENTMIPPA
jgi:mannose-1-phosphate guanylyltransferase